MGATGDWAFKMWLGATPDGKDVIIVTNLCSLFPPICFSGTSWWNNPALEKIS